MMSIRFSGKSLLVLALLAGCGRAPAPSEAAKDISAPASPAVGTTEVNQPLVASEVGVSYSIASPPRLDPVDGSIKLTVSVVNKGSKPLGSHGKFPVNLGVQVAGDSGLADSANGVVDFLRFPIPDLRVGGGGEIGISIPPDARLDGRGLNIDLVQEQVSWFAGGFGQPMLVIGPYKLCGKAFCDLGTTP